MQKNIKTFPLIPVLSSAAGNCLTLANWQSLGIEMVSYSLDVLLVKPGLDLLKKLDNFESYSGWNKNFVLNASTLSKKNDLYKLRSSFDGSKIEINEDDLLTLIIQLKPNIVILPKTFSLHVKEQLDTTFIKSFIAEEDYFFYETSASFEEFKAQLLSNSVKELYVSGDFNLEQFSALKPLSLRYIESNKPAADAVIGQIYSKNGPVDLLDKSRAMEDFSLETTCNCPSCDNNFTRSYLHHLLLNTPLLAERFLIQHNVYYCNHLGV